MFEKTEIFIIKIYKKVISPFLGNNCRFYPTCSTYYMEALKKHGFFYGNYLGVKRVLRCHPLNPGGYDPVPEKKARGEKWKKD
jgi:putative membrane protein insertion efficiency factor